MPISPAKLRKHFEIKENEVIAKEPCEVIIDLSEYKNIEAEYGDIIDIEESTSVYKIPGFFRVEFASNDAVEFFFPYSVYLNKMENTVETSKLIQIEYQEGDVVFYAKFREEETDVKILDKLFDHGAKYLADKPDKLIQNIWTQLKPSSKVPFHHIEVIVSQLYGFYDDQAGVYKPLRLSNHKYSKDFILTTKQSSHMLNNSMGFLYGYSNDALRSSVQKRKKYQNNFFEDILSGNYEKLIEDSKK